MFYYALLFKAKQRFAYLLLTQSVYLFMNVLFLFWSVFHFYVFVSIRYQNNLISKLYYRRTCIIIDILPIVYLYCIYLQYIWQFIRAGNSLIGFPSESLFFCPKMSEWAICWKKWVIHSFAHFWWVTWAIHSWSLISSERTEQITHGCSFLVSNLSDTLTSLIWFERNERFTHNAHQTRGNERKWAIC